MCFTLDTAGCHLIGNSVSRALEQHFLCRLLRRDIKQLCLMCFFQFLQVTIGTPAGSATLLMASVQEAAVLSVGM